MRAVPNLHQSCEKEQREKRAANEGRNGTECGRMVAGADDLLVIELPFFRSVTISSRIFAGIATTVSRTAVVVPPPPTSGTFPTHKLRFQITRGDGVSIVNGIL